MTAEKSKRWIEFWQKRGILQDEYIWRGTIGDTEDHLEKSSLKYSSDLNKLIKEYEDLVEDD